MADHKRAGRGGNSTRRPVRRGNGGVKAKLQRLEKLIWPQQPAVQPVPALLGPSLIDLNGTIKFQRDLWQERADSTRVLLRQREAEIKQLKERIAALEAELDSKNNLQDVIRNALIQYVAQTIVDFLVLAPQ